MTHEQLTEEFIAGRWYYAQGLGGKNRNTIIFAKNKKEATLKGKAWQQREGFKDLHLYRNNYKKEARAMIAFGNYIT